MSDDLFETLWAQFAIEADEHLDLIEPLLASSGPTGVDADGIGQLFRSFHSIKGLARAMDMTGMETMAHKAENLLGLVRDGTVPLDAAMTDLLLAAFDQLKRGRDAAVASRQNLPAPADLADTLERAFQAASAGTPVGAASLAGSLAAVTAPGADPAASAPEAGAETGGGDESGLLHADQEMMDLFVELVREKLPELALIATPAMEDAERRAVIAESCEQLINAANVMDFELLADNLQRLHALLSGTARDEAARRDRLQILGELRMQLDLIGEITGADIGSSAFANGLIDALGPEAARQIQELNDALGQLELSVADGEMAQLPIDAAEIAQMSRAAHATFGCLGQSNACSLLLLLEDVHARMVQGDLAPDGALFALLRQAIEAVDPRLVDGQYRADDVEGGVERALAEGIRGALKTGGQGAGQAQIIAGRLIKGETAILLTGEQIAELETLLADPRNQLYDVLAHLDADEDAGASIAAVLARQSTVITSRTVLVEQASWFDFLAVSDLDGPAFVAALSGVDPEARCLKGVAIVEAEGSRDLFGQQLPPEPVAQTGTSAPRPQAAATGGGGGGGAGGQVLRVRSETIDRFMTLIGEMRTALTALSLTVDREDIGAALTRLGQLGEKLPEAEAAEARRLLTALGDFRRQTRQQEELLDRALGRLHSGALDLRVVPIDTVFNRFPRVVRDLAASLGKDVQLILEGRDVRVDKSMVELLVDPLMHMVRNSVDHGVEMPDERRGAGKPPQATVSLRAAQRGSEVVVEIADDGRGLKVDAIRAKGIERGLVSAADAPRLTDAEIFRFIFLPGFSTAKAVTETSGRGVGMDVVSSSVTKLGGSIDIDSAVGKGTTFTLRMPLSAAMQNTLLVDAGGQTVALPERNVAAVREVQPEDLQTVGGLQAITWRDGHLPVYRLGALLGYGEPVGPLPPVVPVVVIANGRHAIGVAVDRLRRRQELFMKDLHPALARFPCVGGASVLGDGQVVLLLDADGLIQLAQRSGLAAQPAAVPA